MGDMTRPLRSLYICYYPITEPLVQTQVVAYLAELVKRGHTIHLLTYETEKMTAAQKRFWSRKLREQGIRWHHLRYHKRPTLPATIYDTMAGVATALKIMRRYNLQIVHARSHVAATMGLILKKLNRTGLLFDIRGLLAEEYVDAGNWTADGLPYRITKAAERHCIDNADGMVVLTERVHEQLFGGVIDENGASTFYREGNDPAPVRVIPCCADLSQIEEQSAEREAMRDKLNLNGKTVLIYVGKFGGWYMQSEMVDFFAAARQVLPDLHFLVLTQSDRQLILDEFKRHGIAEDAFTVTQSAPDRVGAYLAAADFAISFIQACPSKISSSPTKFGEYLAAGLPVVCNPGVGDVDTIVLRHDVGALVEAFTAEAYQVAARRMLELSRDSSLCERCRTAAHAHASLEEIGGPRYDSLYREIAVSLSI